MPGFQSQCGGWLADPAKKGKASFKHFASSFFWLWDKTYQQDRNDSEGDKGDPKYTGLLIAFFKASALLLAYVRLFGACAWGWATQPQTLLFDRGSFLNGTKEHDPAVGLIVPPPCCPWEQHHPPPGSHGDLAWAIFAGFAV